MAGGRHPCRRHLRPYAFIKLLGFAQWLDASRSPQFFPAPLVFAQRLLSLASLDKRPHQGIPCILMRWIERDQAAGNSFDQRGIEVPSIGLLKYDVERRR